MSCGSDILYDLFPKTHTYFGEWLTNFGICMAPIMWLWDLSKESRQRITVGSDFWSCMRSLSMCLLDAGELNFWMEIRSLADFRRTTAGLIWDLCLIRKSLILATCRESPVADTVNDLRVRIQITWAHQGIERSWHQTVWASCECFGGRLMSSSTKNFH